MANTTKYTIPKLSASAFIKDGPADINTALDTVDAAMAGYAQGTSTPAAATAGKFFRRTDTGVLYFDTGSTLVPVAALTGGKSIIATEETRTNTAYGLLTTPDRVQNVVLPTDGLIEIFYKAQWRCSTSGGNLRAAIFIGANQLKVSVNSAGAAVTQAASRNTLDNNYGHLASCGFGLVSSLTPSASDTDVATGQAVAVAPTQNGSDILGHELNGSLVNLPALIPLGGPVTVFAAAGTYDISVQFKSSTSGVQVKNRKLWVRATAF